MGGVENGWFWGVLGGGGTREFLEVFMVFCGGLWDFVGVVWGGGGGWLEIIHNIFYHSGVSWKCGRGCYLKT